MSDIELLTTDPALHRDNKERARLINESDVTFLCLERKRRQGDEKHE